MPGATAASRNVARCGMSNAEDRALRAEAKRLYKEYIGGVKAALRRFPAPDLDVAVCFEISCRA